MWKSEVNLGCVLTTRCRPTELTDCRKAAALINLNQSMLTARWATIILKSLYFCLPSRKPLTALCCSQSARRYVLGKTMVGGESQCPPAEVRAKLHTDLELGRCFQCIRKVSSLVSRFYSNNINLFCAMLPAHCVFPVETVSKRVMV